MPNEETTKIILEFPASSVSIELGTTITFDNISGFLSSDRVTVDGDTLTEKLSAMDGEIAEKADSDDVYDKIYIDNAFTGVNNSLNNKMDKSNPTGTGSFSLNRKEGSTVGYDSVAIGTYNEASGSASFAEGSYTTASGNHSHAEGIYNVASKSASHAEGSNTTASGQSSHAEGSGTTASGNTSHAEGSGTTASGNTSHAEGSDTTASGDTSHAEGSGTTAIGQYSHAEGSSTTASRRSQHVFGEYNDFESGSQYTKGNYVEIVGNGTGSNNRSNARTLDWSGNETLAGDLTYNGNKSITSEVQRLDDKIDALPEPMVFKGTLGVGGTIQTLPTASTSNEGYTYKVITAGTYAGTTAKVGDVFTSDGSAWVLIPSGDEDSDTWRAIKVNGVEKLGNGISSGSLDVVDTDNIEAEFDNDGNKLKIKTKNIYTQSEVDTLIANAVDSVLPTDSVAKSAIATFETDLAKPIEFKAYIVATQDLHGQDSPFPAGGGKNLFPPKEVSTQSVTITLRADGGIQINGTSESAFNATVVSSLKAGTYTLSCRFSGTTPSEGAARCQIYHQGTGLNVAVNNQDNTNTNKPVVASEDLIGVEFRIRISANFNYQNVVYYPQLEKGSTMTNFVPYAVENICPIGGWSATEITRCGKNLLNTADVELHTSDGSNQRYGVLFAKSGTYRISGSYDGDAFIYARVISGNNYGSAIYIQKGAKTTATPKTVVVGTGEYMLLYNASANQNVELTQEKFANIQVEVGSTETTYEAYNGNKVTIALGDTYYGGYVSQDKDGHRQLVVTHNISKFDELNWSRSNNGGVWQAYLFYVQIPEKVNGGSLACTNYHYGIYTLATMPDKEITRTASSKYIYVRDDDYTDIPTFKTANANTVVLYELAEPFYIDLPDGEPLNALIGTNNLFADSGDMECSFKCGVAMYVDNHSGGGNRSVNLAKSVEEEVKNEPKDEPETRQER